MTDQPTVPYSCNRCALDVSLLIVRVIVGIIFFVHGAQKLFGWFEGYGITKTIEMMEMMGV